MWNLFYLGYTLAWTIGLPFLYLATRFFVKKWQHGLNMKLGKLNPEAFPISKRQETLWFHAVSVGELNALIPLLKQFIGLKVLVSVGTETAFHLAYKKLTKEIEEQLVKLIYMPWDHPLIIRKVLDRINPAAIIIMESEIWPALIYEAQQRKTQIAIVNAKLSDRSFKAYSTLYGIFRPIFARYSLVITQSPADSRRYLRMGVAKSKIFMTGNMKFSVLPELNRHRYQDLREDLGYTTNDIVITCGSTHEEEEALLIAIFQELKTSFPNIRLILAPRHPERFSIVEDLINCAALLEPIRFSKVKNSKTKINIEKANQVLLIDTIGDLLAMYAISDIALVGGTINEKVGGHNVLEPAAFAVPVVIGPHYHKNTHIIEMMDKAGAIHIAETKEEIRTILEKLIIDPDKRLMTGANGKKLTDEHKKIVVNVAQILKKAFFASHI